MSRSDYYLIIGWLLMTPALWLLATAGFRAVAYGKPDWHDHIAGIVFAVLPWWAIYFWIATWADR